MTMGIPDPKYAEVGAVSGVPVDDPVQNEKRGSNAGATSVVAGTPVERGEAQPPAFRDKWFALAFVAHLGAVGAAACALGPAAWRALAASAGEATAAASSAAADAGTTYSFEGSGGSDVPLPPAEFWFAVVATSLVVAPALSFLAFVIMGKNAASLIQASLWFSVVLCGLAAAVLLPLAPFAGVIYAVFAVCLAMFARRVRHRIPYAASNLKCSIDVLTANMGLVLVSLASTVGLAGYSLGWAAAFLGVMQLDFVFENAPGAGSYGGDGADQSGLTAAGGFVGFLFLLSFYWTHQVLRNVVRTTVAGVVGTWWFSPRDAASFCSAAVSGSCVRSATYSLGSICFGSLIVALLTMARDSLRRAQRRESILTCLAACILAYIEWLVEYFNKWAYIYVGLYGYSYMEAGKRVIDLFKARGWETIIADNLVNRLLGIVSLVVGLATGLCALCAAFLVEEFEAKGGWTGVGFGAGFFIGLLVGGVFMGLLSSAVDGIIVCYAEAPKELEENHPAVAQEMSRTWAAAWGEELTGLVVVPLSSDLGVV